MDVTIDIRKEGSDNWMWGMWDDVQELFVEFGEYENEDEIVESSSEIIKYLSGKTFEVTTDLSNVGTEDVWLVYKDDYGHSARMILKINGNEHQLGTYFTNTEEETVERVNKIAGQELKIAMITFD